MSLDLNSDKAQQIQTKAIRLFAEHGFERVKISDITNELGMGKGTFYLYFKNKRELLLECFKQLEALVSNFENKPQVRDERDFFVRMKNRMIALQEQYMTTMGVLNLLRNAVNSTDDEIRESARVAYEAIISPLSKDIRETSLKNQIKVINPELGAYVVLGMAESLAFRVNLDNELREDAVDLFYKALKRTFL